MIGAFAYLMLLIVYVALGLLLVGVAALVAVIPSYRPTARWVALGVLGSFSGVFAFQVLVFPIVWTILFALALAYGGQHLTEPLAIGISIGGVMLILTSFALASLYGFVFGWRAANALWEGARFKTVLTGDPVCRRLAKYRVPLLLGLLLVGSATATHVLRGWLNSGIAVEDVIGTYRAKYTSEKAVLEVRLDRTWKYTIDRQPEFHRSGTWTLEERLGTPTEVVICFNRFELGFPRYPGDIQRGPSFFMSYFSRTYSGGIRWCLNPDGGDVCFERLPAGP